VGAIAETGRTLLDILEPLSDVAPDAIAGGEAARALLAACGKDGRLPEALRPQLVALVQALERGLAS